MQDIVQWDYGSWPDGLPKKGGANALSGAGSFDIATTCLSKTSRTKNFIIEYQERHATPRRATDATRLALTWLSRWFDWRQALVMVQPATLLHWHREGFRLFWRWKSRRGRPPLPAHVQALIRQMARENPTWGQERIANELLLKLGVVYLPTADKDHRRTRQLL